MGIDPQYGQSGFVKTDDNVTLYWRTVGQGPPLVCCNGVGVSTFFWKYLCEHFRDRYTLVLWDYRGHGRSDRSIDATTHDLTVQRHADDLHTVLSEIYANGQPAIFVGHSMGCQVILEYQQRYPHNTKALILMLGTAGRALTTFFDWHRSPTIFKAVHRLVFSYSPAANRIARSFLKSPLAWPIARRVSLVDPLYAKQDDLMPYMEHLASLDMRVFFESVMQLNEHDAWGMLDNLDRPMLVIAAENDSFAPLSCAQRIADRTPNAELLVLAEGSHAALVEQPETINHRIDRFLNERVDLISD